MDFHILDSFILWEKCQNDACVCPRVQQERLSAVFALHYQMNLSAVRSASAFASAAIYFHHLIPIRGRRSVYRPENLSKKIKIQK